MEKTFKSRTFELMLCALFAALSAILSQIAIPIGPVPINLTHLSIFLAAGLLGAKYGTLSQVIFVLLGAAGIPVFSNLTGGLGKILGPTGGFIIGYIACALITGLIIDRFCKSGISYVTLISAMYAGWLVTYIPGVIWFIYITDSNLASAMSLCVIPFLPGDILKTVLSAILIKRLRPVLKSKL